MCSMPWKAIPKAMSTHSGNGIQFINAQGEPDVLPLGELDSVEMTPNCSFQDYAGRPSHPGDKRPWIRKVVQKDNRKVYDCIREITLGGIKPTRPQGRFWTTQEDRVMCLLKERGVAPYFWPRILGRTVTSVRSRSKKMFGS
jgi:hypothetical protein